MSSATIGSEYRIRREAEAAKVLLAGLREIFGSDDAEFLADAVAGQTDLLESIDAALAEIDSTEVLIAGLREKEAQFFQRRRGMEERVKRFRTLIEQAMAITEQAKLRRPTATLSLRKVAPDVVVTTEADIPAEFFIPQPPPPPKLDKAALKEALATRETKIAFASSLSDERQRADALAAIPAIPGAVLNNGGYSLQIRRS
jgi:hypothetical protein